MIQGSLLLVDDDRQVLESMTEWLRDQGFAVDASTGYVDALEKLRQKSYDLLLVDVRLQDGDGFDLLEQVRRNYPDSHVILVTGYGDADSAVEALRAGALDYLTKPLIDDELLMTIERAFNQRQVIEENTQLRKELDKHYAMDNIVGQNPRMLRVFDMIESIADTKSTVLITGESGTGKSMIARAIHRRSSRSSKPFIEVACGALPENLLESELFGHVAGAFTGATGDKIGKFMQANGGTIFLDEVTEMPLALQAKLLRVLQEGTVERLGAQRAVKVDLRIVAATNRDPQQAVSEGTMRQDLFFRLNVVRVDVPPLRERHEDIQLLAEHFLEKYSAELGRPVPRLTEAALRSLHAYGWPGNVRELENLMERAAVLCRGKTVDPQHLPQDVGHAAAAAAAAAGPAGTAELDSLLLDEHVAALEKQLIQAALQRSDDNKSAASRLLGVSERTLWYKIKKYDL